MVAIIPNLLFSQHLDALHRIILFAGGLYLFVLVSYLLFIILTRIILDGESATLNRVLSIGWMAMAVFGLVGLSIWNGYTNGAVVVSLAVGAAPVLAFTTGAILVFMFNAIVVDMPPWAFLVYLPLGVVLGALSFALGVGIGAIFG